MPLGGHLTPLGIASESFTHGHPARMCPRLSTWPRPAPWCICGVTIWRRTRKPDPSLPRYRVSFYAQLGEHVYQGGWTRRHSARVITRDLSEKIEASIIQHCESFTKGTGHCDHECPEP